MGDKVKSSVAWLRFYGTADDLHRITVKAKRLIKLGFYFEVEELDHGASAHVAKALLEQQWGRKKHTEYKCGACLSDKLNGNMSLVYKGYKNAIPTIFDIQIWGEPNFRAPVKVAKGKKIAN